MLASADTDRVLAALRKWTSKGAGSARQLRRAANALLLQARQHAAQESHEARLELQERMLSAGVVREEPGGDEGVLERRPPPGREGGDPPGRPLAKRQRVGSGGKASTKAAGKAGKAAGKAGKAAGKAGKAPVEQTAAGHGSPLGRAARGGEQSAAGAKQAPLERRAGAVAAAAASAHEGGKKRSLKDDPAIKAATERLVQAHSAGDGAAIDEANRTLAKVQASTCTCACGCACACVEGVACGRVA